MALTTPPRQRSQLLGNTSQCIAGEGLRPAVRCPGRHRTAATTPRETTCILDLQLVRGSGCTGASVLADAREGVVEYGLTHSASAKLKECWDDGEDIISGYKVPMDKAWVLDEIESGVEDKGTRLNAGSWAVTDALSGQSNVRVAGAMFDDLVALSEKEASFGPAWSSPRVHAATLDHVSAETGTPNGRVVELEKMLLKGLRALCRNYGLALMGTKSELVRRIVAHENHSTQIPTQRLRVPVSELWSSL